MLNEFAGKGLSAQLIKVGPESGRSADTAARRTRNEPVAAPCGASRDVLRYRSELQLLSGARVQPGCFRQVAAGFRYSSTANWQDGIPAWPARKSFGAIGVSRIGSPFCGVSDKLRLSTGNFELMSTQWRVPPSENSWQPGSVKQLAQQ